MAQTVKNPPANAGDPGSIHGLERFPGVENGKPLQYSCLENPMDRGAWWGYGPWDCKELDTTYQLNTYAIKYSYRDGATNMTFVTKPRGWKR